MATSKSSEKTTVHKLRGKKKEGSKYGVQERNTVPSVDRTVNDFKNKIKRIDQELTKARKEMSQRCAEIEVINSVQEGLASKLDMQGIYDLIGKKVRDLFHVEVVDIVNYDPESNLISMPYSYEKGDRSVIEPREPYGFRLQVIESCKPLLIDRDFKKLALLYNNPVLTGTWPKSALFVPLLIEGKVKSIISIQDLDREDAYSSSDVLLLQTLAHSMGIALENARLFTETQRLLKETEDRNAELAIINSVQEALAAQLDMHSIYEAVGEKLREIFHYQDVTIYTSDIRSNIVTVEYSYELGQKSEQRYMPMNSLYEYFLNSKKTFIFNGNLPSLAANFSDYENPEPPKSLLAVPVRRNMDSEPVVYLTIQDWEGKKVFSDSDVRLMETLANSMSVALENARLWEQEKLYRKALQRELEIGREIQAGFLPDSIPQVNGWEIVALLMSAREVAGDFYDVFELPDGNIGLVIADVCDKGVGAALFMTLFRSLIRAASNLEYFEHTESVQPLKSAAERLKRAVSLTNNYIAETHGKSGMFATLFFGILDPQCGRLVYINGGHEPPLVLHAGIGKESLLKTGPAVGAITDGYFDLSETILNVGDVLLAFTDGVPDCKNPQGDFYGRERLFGIFQREYKSAQELVNVIEADLHGYISNATQFDDITLLAIQRKK